MARRFLTIIVCVFCAFGSMGLTDAELYMSADKIKRGMKGIGLTVFQGTRIDTFEVEVLGVLRNVLGPKSDMILARLSGGPLEQTGVIAGMSGSPVYIDGKLIGALGYSIGSFAKEPIAGITPIKEMMQVLERISSDTLSSATFGSRKREMQLAEINGGVLKPVAVPLMLSGFASQVVMESRQELSEYGLLPMQGGGGTDSSLEVGAFEPGASLGAQLIRGDLSATTIGTLTHRVGDRVVGFGHPMMWSGRTAMPMTAAYIHQVVSSQMLSFKYGTASQSMGIILQDRAPGIAGVVGSDAKMMPIRVTVLSPGQATSFNMEVFRHRELGPLLVRMAVATSVISAEKLAGETTVNGQLTLHMPGFEPVVVENMYAGPQGLGLAVLGLTQPLAQVIQNPFIDAAIDSAVFQLSIEERTRGARIDGLRLDRSHYDPGDTVQVSIALAPILGKREVIELELPIPIHFAPGRLMLQAVNEHEQKLQDRKRAPGAYDSKNLEDLVRLIKQPGRNDALVVRFVASQPGVTMGGHEVSGLPMSVMSALSLSRGSNVIQKLRQSVFGQKRVITDYVLSGSQSAVFMVGKDSDGPTFSGKGDSGEQKR